MNARNWEGATPLLLSLIREASDELIELLITSGSDINIANNENVTPLHVAVQRRSSIISDLLIKEGADIEAKDFDGFTPMLDAIRTGSTENIYLLLYYNADMHVKATYIKITPIQMAFELIHDDTLLDILLEYVVDRNEICMTRNLLLNSFRMSNEVIVKLVTTATDVNYFCTTYSCVHSVMLLIERNDLFHLIWPRIDLKILLRYSPNFLLEYCTLCKYDNEDFINCLKIILSSSIASKLCQETTLMSLLVTKTINKLTPSQRASIIYILLSVGINVTYEDLHYIHKTFGFGEELDIFVQLNLNVLEPMLPNLMSPLTRNVLCVERNSNNFSNNFECICCSDLLQLINHYTLKPLLTNFEHADFLEEYMNELHSVPSLIEISRNKFRESLSNIYNPSKPFDCYNKLKDIPLPDALIDVVMLKSPLYHYTIKKRII